MLPRHFYSRWWEGLTDPERRGYEDDSISSDKQHGDVPLGGLEREKEIYTLTSRDKIHQVIKENIILMRWWEKAGVKLFSLGHK